MQKKDTHGHQEKHKMAQYQSSHHATTRIEYNKRVFHKASFLIFQSEFMNNIKSSSHDILYFVILGKQSSYNLKIKTEATKQFFLNKRMWLFKKHSHIHVEAFQHFHILNLNRQIRFQYNRLSRTIV